MISTEKALVANSAEAQGEFLVIVTANGQFRIRWEACSVKLAGATAEQRARFTLSPSGYGLHWPGIDEDLSVKGLIEKAN